MALQKDYIKNVHGKEVVFEDAYHRIESFQGTKTSMVVLVAIYTDNECRVQIASKQTILQPELEIADNFITQSYNHLKNLPEYADSLDV